MNSYKNIPIWENSRRLRVLEQFHSDAITYFFKKERKDEDGAGEAHQRINFAAIQALHIIRAAGVNTKVTYSPPPATGRPDQRIELISNLYQFGEFSVPESVLEVQLISFIEMALGVYRIDRPGAWRRTINPLWWLFRGLLWFVRIPFVFLGAVGFDAARAERSASGKFFKATFALLTAAAALLTILNLLGWLSAAKSLLGIE